MLFGSSSDDPTLARRPEPANAGGQMESYNHAWRERMGEHQNGVADNWWWYKNRQKMLEQVKQWKSGSIVSNRDIGSKVL